MLQNSPERFWMLSAICLQVSWNLQWKLRWAATRPLWTIGQPLERPVNPQPVHNIGGLLPMMVSHQINRYRDQSSYDRDLVHLCVSRGGSSCHCRPLNAASQPSRKALEVGGRAAFLPSRETQQRFSPQPRAPVQPSSFVTSIKKLI